MTLRLTEGELKAIQQRHAGFKSVPRPLDVRTANLVPGGHTTAAKKAKEAKKKKGMNKWEESFARTLEWQRSIGQIAWWGFEPFRIRLADGCFFRPDFVTVDLQGKTAIYEVKGHFREAARVRLRVAAEKLPYPFYIVKKSKGQLQVTPL